MALTPTKTGTPTKTFTTTATSTKTATPTFTYTWTITPTPTPTVQCGVDTSSLALLEEYTSSCTSSSVYHLFAVVNHGAAVTLSDITFKFWPYETSGVSLVGSITTGGCIWNPTCSHNATGVTLTRLYFTPACGPTTTQMANWEMTVSTTDNTVLSSGASWVGIQTLVNRSDSQPFVPGTNYWYSPCVNASAYTTNSHFCLYLRGNLVSAAGGVPPSCRPLPTCTPIGGGKAVRGSLEEQTTPTQTATLTPMPTAIPELVQSIVVAPNLSTNQQPIQFRLGLGRSAHVSLNLYNIAGERAYSTQVQTSSGNNILEWDLQNNTGSQVASGLYIYVLEIDDGYFRQTRTGKVVVIK